MRRLIQENLLGRSAMDRDFLAGYLLLEAIVFGAVAFTLLLVALIRAMG